MNNLLLQNLVTLIAKHTGLSIREQDKQALCNKVVTRMQLLNLNTPEQYYQLLNTSTDNSSTDTPGDREWRALTLLLTTGESYFFRDKGQIALLKNRLLPQLIEQKRRSSQQNSVKPSLRIWSAGCSTGEEVYSIAILVKELIPDLHNWQILILGTDLNLESIDKAKKGVYEHWSFRMVEPEIIRRYFKRCQQSWKVKETICSMVKFQPGNLIKDNFPQLPLNIHCMDIIICRNVFIYFDTNSISKVIQKFYHTLNPGGYLVTGHAELHGQNMDKFQTKVFPESLVYQRENSLIEKPVTPKKLSPSSSITNQVITVSKQNLTSFIHKIEVAQPTNDADLITNINRAQMLFYQQEYIAAIQAADRLIQQHPQHFEAYYVLAQSWANLGKLEKATFYCEKAIEIDTFATLPYYLLTHIAEEKSDVISAKKFLKKILYLDPNAIDAYLELGDIYQHEGDIIRAKKMRTIAWDLLNQLPSHFLVEPSKNTVSELKVQVNNLLHSHS